MHERTHRANTNVPRTGRPQVSAHVNTHVRTHVSTRTHGCLRRLGGWQRLNGTTSHPFFVLFEFYFVVRGMAAATTSRPYFIYYLFIIMAAAKLDEIASLF